MPYTARPPKNGAYSGGAGAVQARDKTTSP